MIEEMDDAIADSLRDAGLVEESDFGELVGTGEGDPETPAAPAEPEADAEGDAEAEGAAAKEAATAGEGDEDDLDRELNEAGVNKGQNTRLRYKTVRKIWEGWKKKQADELGGTHKKAVDDLNARIAASTERLRQVDVANQLIVRNPRAYLEMLATANPKVREFLNFQQERAAAAAAGDPRAAAGTGEWKMPDPDAEFPDGSRGFSMDGIRGALTSFGSHLTQQLKKDFQKEYGQPLQNLTQQQRQEKERSMHWNRVQSDVAWAQETFGQVFADDFGALGNIKADSAVMKVIQDSRDPQTGLATITLRDACVAALLPRIQKTRDELYDEWKREARERPAAARRSTPGAARASAPSTPGTVEEVIADEMRKAGMI